jgi:hypothetical protein
MAQGQDDGQRRGGVPARAGELPAALETPRQVADALRLWATEHNLLRHGTSPALLAEQPVGIIPMPAEAAGIFERQAITAFGVNDRRSRVYVYTNKRVTKSQSALLPPNVQGAVEIVYRQARPIVIGSEEEDPVIGLAPYYISAGRYACGSSIGVGNHRSAGTLGALVRDGDGNLFGLTNNHVIGGCNNSRRGLPIVAPGVMDVMANTRSPFTVGLHRSVLTCRQGEPTTVNHRENTDAAIMEILDPDSVSSMQGELYDTPNQIADPEADMEVEKVGRTTGHQRGIIESEIVGPWPLTYKTVTYHSPNEAINFVGTVFFEPVFLIQGHDGAFSQPGDSGSLVTTVVNNERLAVGLVFAGRGNDASYMLPIRPILERLGASLVAGHGTV